MADELTIRASLSFTKSGRAAAMSEGPTTFDVAGTKCLENVQAIGTSEEAVVVGDVGAGGYFMGKNLDATNYIELRGASGGADLARLEPGDVCLFRLTDDATLYAIADTAACDLAYAIVSA